LFQSWFCTWMGDWLARRELHVAVQARDQPFRKPEPQRPTSRGPGKRREDYGDQGITLEYIHRKRQELEHQRKERDDYVAYLQAAFGGGDARPGQAEESTRVSMSALNLEPGATLRRSIEAVTHGHSRLLPPAAASRTPGTRIPAPPEPIGGGSRPINLPSLGSSRIPIPRAAWDRQASAASTPRQTQLEAGDEEESLELADSLQDPGPLASQGSERMLAEPRRQADDRAGPAPPQGVAPAFRGSAGRPPAALSFKAPGGLVRWRPAPAAAPVQRPPASPLVTAASHPAAPGPAPLPEPEAELLPSAKEVVKPTEMNSRLKSIGSAGHSSGTCSPCCFFPQGCCMSGQSCEFCHEDHFEASLRRSRGPRGPLGGAVPTISAPQRNCARQAAPPSASPAPTPPQRRRESSSSGSDLGPPPDDPGTPPTPPPASRPGSAPRYRPPVETPQSVRSNSSEPVRRLNRPGSAVGGSRPGSARGAPRPGPKPGRGKAPGKPPLPGPRGKAARVFGTAAAEDMSRKPKAKARSRSQIPRSQQAPSSPEVTRVPVRADAPGNEVIAVGLQALEEVESQLEASLKRLDFAQRQSPGMPHLQEANFARRSFLNVAKEIDLLSSIARLDGLLAAVSREPEGENNRKAPKRRASKPSVK